MSRRWDRSRRGQAPARRPRAARRAVVALAAVAGLAHGSVASAQDSFFSLQFLGVSEETGDVRARSLGTLGIALDDPQTAITLNPASLAALQRMTISVMGGAGSRTARDSATTVDRSESTFPHLRFALPVPGKIVMSVGLVAMRNYRSSFVLPPMTVSGLLYTQAFQRKGSLYEVPLGVARHFGNKVHLGATLDFLLGTVDDAWVTGGDSLVSVRTRRRDDLGGTTVTLGAVVTPLKALRLGGTFTPEVTLERTTITTIEDSRLNNGAPPLRTHRTKSNTRLPATYRGGATCDLGSHLLVTADLTYRDWGQYEGRLYGAESVGKESRVGGGIEFKPRKPVWWGRASYRAGLSRYVWPQELGGNSLVQTTGHLGTGFDLKGGVGRLDAMIEYSSIGSLDRNGYDEKRWTFLLSISGQETWRRRSPRSP